MALADEVTARYSTALLVNLTRPQSSTSTTVNTTVLGYACTDVEAEFAKVGITFAVGTATHVVTACEGVIALLRKRTGQAGGWEEWREWREVQLERLRLVTTNDRIEPSSTSEVTPTDENPNNDAYLRPDFDQSHFDHLVPQQPRSTRSDDYTADP